MNVERFRYLSLGLTGVFVLTLTSPMGVRAQGREAPNVERSSYDTLFEQSDLGNVAQRAQMSHGVGMRELKRAESLAAKLDGLEGKKRDSTEEKIASAYAKAIASFEEALGFNPSLVAAHGGLARALRGSGKAAESLLVISLGLQAAPEDPDLHGEWALSVTAIDMAEDAPRAYQSLAETDPVRAQTLMQAMKAWAESPATAPGSGDPAGVDRLAAWIALQESS